jgi:DNA-binding NtrC family response regulator
MKRPEAILVIDDEEVIRDVLHTLLTQAGYRVVLAEDGPSGLALARQQEFDAVVLDLMLPEMGGLEVLQEENRQLRTALADQARFTEIVGKSAKMQEVFRLIAQAAPSRSTILVVGESGTGKELVAKAIHAHSPRAEKSFVVVNSGSLPHDLLESNMFGHVKGAFTGAIYTKKGLFELADKGTLFFDEIGNIPLETQAKLLRVMQEREFMRLGGVDLVKVDVRIVAATNVDLRRLVEEGRFREDLYYRLNVITIQLPPLRQRKEDIPALVSHFAAKYSLENDRATVEVTREAMQVLLDYDWPGNVRELENVVERGVVLSTDGMIGRDLIPEHVIARQPFHIPRLAIPPDGIKLKQAVASFERSLIEATLDATGGVQKEAARLLDLRPTTLNEMIKRHGIVIPRDKERRTGGDSDDEMPKPSLPLP